MEKENDITEFNINNKNRSCDINTREYQKDNPEKLATQGTQNEEKLNKNTKQYVLDTTMRK